MTATHHTATLPAPAPPPRLALVPADPAATVEQPTTLLGVEDLLAAAYEHAWHGRPVPLPMIEALTRAVGAIRAEMTTALHGARGEVWRALGRGQESVLAHLRRLDALVDDDRPVVLVDVCGAQRCYRVRVACWTCGSPLTCYATVGGDPPAGDDPGDLIADVEMPRGCPACRDHYGLPPERHVLDMVAEHEDEGRE